MQFFCRKWASDTKTCLNTHIHTQTLMCCFPVLMICWIILLLLLLVNVWFWILLVTEFKLLDLQTMQCDWLASIYTYIDAYRYLYMRVYIFLIFFTYLFMRFLHQICTRMICRVLVSLGMSVQILLSDCNWCSVKLLWAKLQRNILLFSLEI